MKILMMGTGPFAVPTFEALMESRHEVCGLVTRPMAGSHRHKRKDINPMRESALRFGLKIHDPPSVNAPEFAGVLQEYAADLFVVCDYGQILSREVLSLSSLGGINLHGSLLPKYRGAAPIHWAIYHGETGTGNSVIHMTPELDGGPILQTVELEIGPEDNAVSIEKSLADLGPKTVLPCIDLLEKWDRVSPMGSLQDTSLATKAPRLSKSDGVIAWEKTSLQIFNQVRAFQPWPGSFSNLVRGQEHDQTMVRLILTKVQPLEQGPLKQGQVGEIIFVDEQKMIVQTGGELLEILELQPAGKKNMAAADFLRGNPVKPGNRFLSEKSP